MRHKWQAIEGSNRPGHQQCIKCGLEKAIDINGFGAFAYYFRVTNGKFDYQGEKAGECQGVMERVNEEREAA